jgi:hypothetical protein
MLLPKPVDRLAMINNERSAILSHIEMRESEDYENMGSVGAFTTAYHVGDMLEAYDKVRAPAESRDHIIPGHDPLVMQLYPAPRPELAGAIVRLDVAPTKRD